MGVDISIHKYTENDNEEIAHIYLDRVMIQVLTLDIFNGKTFFEYLCYQYNIDIHPIHNFQYENHYETMQYKLKLHEQKHIPFDEEWEEEKENINKYYQEKMDSPKTKSNVLNQIIIQLLKSIRTRENIFQESLIILNSKNNMDKITGQIFVDNIKKINTFLEHDNESICVQSHIE